MNIDFYKHPQNPILSSKDIPYASNQVYNAGVIKYQGKYVMVFRNDYDRSHDDFKEHAAKGLGFPPVKINLGIAYSDDGINWEVADEPCFELANDEIKHAYDPRLTVLEGRVYICFAIDTRHGVRGGIAVTDDFDKFKILNAT